MQIGQIIIMKKAHPCGCAEFEILRLGSDIKIKCISCGREVILPRVKLEKNIKLIKENI